MNMTVGLSNWLQANIDFGTLKYFQDMSLLLNIQYTQLLSLYVVNVQES